MQGFRDILLLFFFLFCTSYSIYNLNSELFPQREVGKFYKNDSILTFMSPAMLYGEKGEKDPFPQCFSPFAMLI